MEDRFEVIDAFVDGRRVDAPDLKRALAEAEGRDYFVDTWLLRETLQDEMAQESIPQTRWRKRSTGGWLLPVAASLVCLIGGGFAGYRIAEMADVAAPIAVTPTKEPSPSTAPPGPSYPVPTPTRAIPVEFTSDSSSLSGGD